MALAAVQGLKFIFVFQKLIHTLSAITKLIPFPSLFFPHSDRHPYFTIPAEFET